MMIRGFSILSGKKVAITGSSGIIGSRIYKSLKELGWDCVGITSGRNFSQGGPKKNSSTCIEPNFVDCIADLTKIEECHNVFKGCSHIIHLAADGRPTSSFNEILRSNMITTYNIYEAAREAGVKRIIFASTNHIQHGFTLKYLNKTGSLSRSRISKLININDIGMADSFYAVSKIYGEEIGKLYSNIWNCFEVISLRIGWILYENPIALKDTEYFDYLMSMWLSQRDCLGFIQSSLEVDLPKRHVSCYTISNNSSRIFDLENSIKALGYIPKDKSENFLNLRIEKRKILGKNI